MQESAVHLFAVYNRADFEGGRRQRGKQQKVLKRCSGSRTEGFRNFVKQKGEH